MENITVSICMISYNHSKFIQEAIASILMQKTNFRYELVIGEDSSTDNTLEICKEYQLKYPDKIKLLVSDKNYGMIPNFVRTLKSCSGKYIAFCEGDDYWTDPLKLQKQIDILEKNEQIGLVYSNYSVVNADGNIMELQKYNRKMPSGNIIQELVKGQFPWTLTVCFRANLIKGFEDVIFKPDYMMGDFPLWLHLGFNYKAKYLDNVTASYRRNAGSATDYNRSYLKKVDFVYSWQKILLDFIDEKKINDIELLNQINNRIQLKLLVVFSLCIQNKDYTKGKEIWDKVKLLKLPIPMKYYLLKSVESLGIIGKWLVVLYFQKLKK